MGNTWGGFLLLILGASFSFSGELFHDLYQRNDQVHLSLLKNSAFYQDFGIGYSDILESYYIGNYKKFIEDFEKEYTSLEVVDNQILFFYLASKYQSAEYSSLKEIIPYINAEVLSLDNWRDFQKIRAVSYYWDGNNFALNELDAYLRTDYRSNDFLLETISKLYQLQLAAKGMSSVSADVDISYYLAWNSLKLGEYGKAVDYFKEANQSELIPVNKKEFISYGLGLALYSSGNKEEALKNLSIAYDDNELLESAKFFQLLINFDEENFEKVVSSSSEFLFSYADSRYFKQVKYLQGASFYALGEKQQARKVLESIQDFNHFVRYLLAEIYYNEGAYEKAKSFFQKVDVSLNDDLGVYAKYGYAWSCFKLAQYKEAESVFETLNKQRGLSEKIKYNIMIKSADSSFNANNYKEAEKKYREFLNKIAGRTDKYNSLYKQAIYNLAKTQMKLRNFKEANNILEKYLSEVLNDKETVVIKTIIANNYYQLKDYISATRIYEELLLIYKELVGEDIFIHLADSYFNAKEYGKALVVYQDYLQQHPKGERDMDARYGMVQTLYQLKDYDAALEQAKIVDDEYEIGLLTEIENKIEFTKEKVSE